MYADVWLLLATDAVLRDGELALEDMESKKASVAHYSAKWPLRPQENELTR